MYFKLYPVGLEREQIKGCLEFSPPEDEKALNLSVKTKKMKRIPADGGGDLFFLFLTFFLNVGSKMLKEIYTCDSVFGVQKEELGAND